MSTVSSDAAAASDFAERCDAFKAAGNDAYKRGDHKVAVQKYGKALSLAYQLDEPRPGKLETNRTATLLANRCMAQLALDNSKAALEDAEAATREAPDWPKAHFRHGTVLMRIKAYTKAYASFKRGWHLDTSNVELTKACQQAHLAMTGLNQAMVDTSATDAGSSSAGGGKDGLLSAEDLTNLRIANMKAAASARAEARKAAAANTTFCASSAAPVASPTYREEALRRTAQMARGGNGGADEERPAAADMPAAPQEAIDVADAAEADGGGIDGALAGGSADAASNEAAAAAGVASLAPPPDYVVTRKPSVDGGADVLVLTVETPGAASMRELELSLSPEAILLEVAGMQPLEVTLPAAVDDAAARAKFDRKTRVLTVTLPVREVVGKD